MTGTDLLPWDMVEFISFLKPHVVFSKELQSLKDLAETSREKADVSTHFLLSLLVSLCFRDLSISYFGASSVMHLNRLKTSFIQSFSGFTLEGSSRGLDLPC